MQQPVLSTPHLALIWRYIQQLAPRRPLKVMAQLPFPLSYIIPWTQRKEVMRRYGGIDAYEVGEGSGGYQHPSTQARYPSSCSADSLPHGRTLHVNRSAHALVTQSLGTRCFQMYADAAAALTALADRLKSSGGAFFFGSRPSSLDAVLVGHLIYFRLCPAAPPVLQQKARQ